MGRPRRELNPGQSPVHLWGAQLRARRDEHLLSLQELADLARYDASYLGRLERGDQFASLAVAEACDLALGAGGKLIELWHSADHERRRPVAGAAAPGAAEAGGPEISVPEQRLIREMSLHAITGSYGEAGLRARFAIEAGQLLDTAGQADAARALELAAALHAGDRRQNESYLSHLLRVTLRIMSASHYGVTDPDVIVAALLHDAVEDHPGGLAASGSQEDALAALAGMFGGRAAALVAAVTNPPREPGVERNAQYREHVIASLRREPWARPIKLSDFTDNGVGLHYTTGPKTVKLAVKYAPLVSPLAALVALPDTPLSSTVKAEILRQLFKAQTRFAAIVPATGGQAEG